jgi:hypothetical protein
MGENDPQKTTQKKPGEKRPGKYHYNPGNMSGKEAGIFKEHDKKKARDSEGHDVDSGRKPDREQ